MKGAPRGSGGTKSLRASASVGRDTAGREIGAACCASVPPLTSVLAAPAAPTAAPFRNFLRSTECVASLLLRLATAVPLCDARETSGSPKSATLVVRYHHASAVLPQRVEPDGSVRNRPNGIEDFLA